MEAFFSTTEARGRTNTIVLRSQTHEEAPCPKDAVIHLSF